jgi:hypothetical protein
MWFAKIFTAVLVALTGLLPASCTTAKKPAAQHATDAEIASQSETNKNLGDLSLTNHYETCVNLGMGRSCTIKPTLVGRSDLRLTMALQSKDVNGQIQNLSVVEVVTKTGKPFEVAVGDMNLTLTPRLSE